MDELPTVLPAFERAARERLEPGPLAYYASGAGAEVTLRDNEEAWQRIRLAPRMLVGVAERDTSVTVLGRRRPHPLVVAPMAYQRLAHPDGEPATARACAARGAIYTLSTLATAGPEEVAAAAPGSDRWFQLYVFRDRGVSRAIVEAAAAAGFEALVVTVDLPVLGLREADHELGWMLPAGLRVPALEAGGRRGPMTVADTTALIDPGLEWRDVEELAAGPLPVLVKGVLRPDDARRAAEAGAAGVVVSNHGGRQLDTVLAGADALPAVAEAVGDRVDVLVDGGVRRGTDVLKAIALGARAVMVGRPVLWGLACGGQAGAERVLELLLEDLDRTLALAGVPRLADAGPDVLA